MAGGTSAVLALLTAQLCYCARRRLLRALNLSPLCVPNRCLPPPPRTDGRTDGTSLYSGNSCRCSNGRGELKNSQRPLQFNNNIKIGWMKRVPGRGDDAKLIHQREKILNSIGLASLSFLARFIGCWDWGCKFLYSMRELQALAHSVPLFCYLATGRRLVDSLAHSASKTRPTVASRTLLPFCGRVCSIFLDGRSVEWRYTHNNIPRVQEYLALALSVV